MNIMDHAGRTPLNIAVRNQSTEMIGLLLEVPGIRLGDSLLFAVKEDDREALMLLLDFQDG